MSIAAYRDRTTGAVLSDAALRAAHPDKSIPLNPQQGDFDFLNIDPVFATPQPAADRLHVVQALPPVQAGGQWQQAWQLVDITAGMAADQLTALKQQICDEKSGQFNSVRDSTIAGGFKYNFSAYQVLSGAPGAVVEPATNYGSPAGTLTMQMGTDDQVNWLGRTAMAQMAIANQQPTTAMALRTAENLNVQMTAATILVPLQAAGAWKDGLIFGCSTAKDTMAAYVADATKTPADVLGVSWP